jgi:hypothetical protein
MGFFQCGFYVCVCVRKPPTTPATQISIKTAMEKPRSRQKGAHTVCRLCDLWHRRGVTQHSDHHAPAPVGLGLHAQGLNFESRPPRLLVSVRAGPVADRLASISAQSIWAQGSFLSLFPGFIGFRDFSKILKPWGLPKSLKTLKPLLGSPSQPPPPWGTHRGVCQRHHAPRTQELERVGRAQHEPLHASLIKRLLLRGPIIFTRSHEFIEFIGNKQVVHGTLSD